MVYLADNTVKVAETAILNIIYGLKVCLFCKNILLLHRN